MRVLTVNAGSSSLKLRLLDADDRVLADETVARWSGEHDLDPLARFLDEVAEVDAVGHRVVHGGPHHRTPARVDEDLLATLDGLTDLAPLHQPRAVAAIRAVSDLLPRTPAVACFDTAFHAGMPAEATTYALPAEWRGRWGLRRYGFHGLSHAYASRRAAQVLGRSATGLRLVTCHLGAGASLAAVTDGRSVDTTMGFTPLAGLVMATRSGSVDPGLLVWLQRYGGVSLDDLEHGLEHRSGLAGLSGTSGDLRDVLAARSAGDDDAALAFGVFTHRLCREIAAMTASVGGLDALVMTGGIGEGSPAVRAEVARRLAYLGVAVDAHTNEATTSDGDVSADAAGVRTLVVTAREDLEISRATRQLLSPAARPG